MCERSVICFWGFEVLANTLSRESFDKQPVLKGFFQNRFSSDNMITEELLMNELLFGHILTKRAKLADF